MFGFFSTRLQLLFEFGQNPSRPTEFGRQNRQTGRDYNKRGSGEEKHQNPYNKNARPKDGNNEFAGTLIFPKQPIKHRPNSDHGTPFDVRPLAIFRFRL